MFFLDPYVFSMFFLHVLHVNPGFSIHVLNSLYLTTIPESGIVGTYQFKVLIMAIRSFKNKICFRWENENALDVEIADYH